MIRIEANIEIEIPTLPNFFRVKGQQMDTVPIYTVSDEDLKRIGIDWTNELIGKAQELRKKNKF